MTAENDKKPNTWLWTGCGVMMLVFVLALGVISIVAYKEGQQRFEVLVEEAKTESQELERTRQELEREIREFGRREQEESTEELNQ